MPLLAVKRYRGKVFRWRIALKEISGLFRDGLSVKMLKPSLNQYTVPCLILRVYRLDRTLLLCFPKLCFLLLCPLQVMCLVLNSQKTPIPICFPKVFPFSASWCSVCSLIPVLFEKVPSGLTLHFLHFFLQF